MSFLNLTHTLLFSILEDKVSDQFVLELIWERLGYQPSKSDPDSWVTGPSTEVYWGTSFPKAPEFIADRKAAIHLTRSIPKQYKQLLKQKLHFSGYPIKELNPRKTRRAIAVSWLLAWIEQNKLGLNRK